MTWSKIWPSQKTGKFPRTSIASFFNFFYFYYYSIRIIIISLLSKVQISPKKTFNNLLYLLNKN
jgi:hypothetical protein